MGLFDMLKEKATELLQGAKDQADEATANIDPPAEDLFDQAVEPVTDAGRTVTETAEGAIDEARAPVDDIKDKLTGPEGATPV
ncbi:hypothetical protein [Actinopolymorpha alba]|uniref:hypothetical protein n=1 Tax=Actinopolymorpha alba TaxID=533267 RepID=UPI000376362C|nr:hypothetical protein [Actinopolymorpha alba]